MEGRYICCCLFTGGRSKVWLAGMGGRLALQARMHMPVFGFCGVGIRFAVLRVSVLASQFSQIGDAGMEFLD
jgi:hypothetical protein